MQAVTEFKHPVHQANAFRLLMKRALRNYVVPDVHKIEVPRLDRDLDYYVAWETEARSAENILVYAVTCFNSLGEILFSKCGKYPVSLWRFRRQGVARSVQILEGTLKQIFNRKNIPLTSDEPFAPMSEGVFLLNINWYRYGELIKNPTHV